MVPSMSNNLNLWGCWFLEIKSQKKVDTLIRISCGSTGAALILSGTTQKYFMIVKDR